jgi:hypothetical protein
MGYEAEKTEHCVPKRGNGAYWGYKWEAKEESNRIRRENWRWEIRATAIDPLEEDQQVPNRQPKVPLQEPESR